MFHRPHIGTTDNVLLRNYRILVLYIMWPTNTFFSLSLDLALTPEGLHTPGTLVRYT